MKAFHYSQCGKITAYSADLALKRLVGIGIQITDVCNLLLPTLSIRRSLPRAADIGSVGLNCRPCPPLARWWLYFPVQKTAVYQNLNINNAPVSFPEI